MRTPDLSSASGLRPVSAMVVIAFVVFTVIIRVSYLALTQNLGIRELTVLNDQGMVPAYGIEDRRGTTLAVFLERLDVVMSPQSMWQAHTPDHMANVLSEALGPEFNREELLASMLPDAEGGVITVDRWEFDATTATRVDEWIRGVGKFEREEPGLLPGIGFETSLEGRLTLVWKPVELLSRETRATFGQTTSPFRWTRSIADSLSAAIFGDFPESITDQDVRKRRREIWDGLMPSEFCRAAKSISAERAFGLAKLLRDEGVESIQMSQVATREREYPAGEFPVMGRWGYTEDGQQEPKAYSGLERFCDDLLVRPEWSFIDTAPGTYSYRRERPARLKHRPYYVGREEQKAPPVVRVTIDVALQRMLRERLQRVMVENEPAVAMAIAVDLESGNVLAVDGFHAYGMAAFAPVKHQFMPGSTFKLITMASALEANVVTPSDMFEVGNGEWPLIIDGKRRMIHEAEGSRHGRISAKECLAYSVNAGLVQIGLKIPAQVFHERLVSLGYGRYANAGLGGEEPGLIPSLPWTPRFAHASVSFGYEISTTMWQHMQGLTTILRGGEYRELRIADSVAYDGQRFDLEQTGTKRVFEPGTCLDVRGMMELGAREGTGKSLFRDDIVMGTKTGTAERVSTEVCLHVYGRAARALRDRGESVPNKLYREKRSVRDPQIHETCHTSSIIAVGRIPGQDREVAVLVVVDEPLVGGHFGSKVAGPPAMDILTEALGMTRNGEIWTEDLIPGFALSSEYPGPRMEDELREQPWNAGATW
ncbi:MAG: cell division protein FtsI/penicillin-binding protein 2 [Planctomycetota bacterium]|jgi:cell division protein FtsI/penicillin-binding protein 2